MGWPHPDYLTAFLTGEQLAGWIDYSGREPFGFPIEDVRAASLMAMVANAAGPKEPFEAAQFLMGPSLVDPVNEDGSQSDDALTLKLLQLMPPPTEGA